MKTLKRHRKKITLIAVIDIAILFGLMLWLGYISVIRSKELSDKADLLHERERYIKASRGKIITRDNVILADNETVCTVSVIHSQIENPTQVVQVLSKELGMSEEKVKKYVDKVSVMETIKSNVDIETGNTIRSYELAGVKVDEDSKRVYPYSNLASKVIGFTGKDNQGIVGLEVKYDDLLKGSLGKILTQTDATGIELDGEEKRVEPVDGSDLYVSLDYSIQCFCTQTAKKTYEAKQAKSVSIIAMNPQNGEILSLVNYPEYDLNNPFLVDNKLETNMDILNNIWRNGVVSNTYEPGSTFKTVTAAAALSEETSSLSDSYYCSGSVKVSGRTIHCAKTTGHGAQSFAQSLMNSCNPAFITWGLRLGKDLFLEYMDKLGLMSLTGVDLPGEAGTIMHKRDNIKELELATMAFGQSFQINPLQLLRAISCMINGGRLVTPHFAVKTVDADKKEEIFEYNVIYDVLSPSICDTMKELMESVVSEGGGSKCYIDGYSIGGKTATSQKLPRGDGRYVASFVGFAPAYDPQIIVMCIIDEPKGIYYGGTIAAPVVKEIFENILPYLGIEKS